MADGAGQNFEFPMIVWSGWTAILVREMDAARGKNGGVPVGKPGDKGFECLVELHHGQRLAQLRFNVAAIVGESFPGNLEVKVGMNLVEGGDEAVQVGLHLGRRQCLRRVIQFGRAQPRRGEKAKKKLAPGKIFHPAQPGLIYTRANEIMAFWRAQYLSW